MCSHCFPYSGYHIKIPPEIKAKNSYILVVIYSRLYLCPVWYILAIWWKISQCVFRNVASRHESHHRNKIEKKITYSGGDSEHPQNIRDCFVFLVWCPTYPENATKSIHQCFRNIVNKHGISQKILHPRGWTWQVQNVSNSSVCHIRRILKV